MLAILGVKTKKLRWSVRIEVHASGSGTCIDPEGNVLGVPICDLPICDLGVPICDHFLIILKAHTQQTMAATYGELFLDNQSTYDKTSLGGPVLF